MKDSSAILLPIFYFFIGERFITFSFSCVIRFARRTCEIKLEKSLTGLFPSTAQSSRARPIDAVTQYFRVHGTYSLDRRALAQNFSIELSLQNWKLFFCYVMEKQQYIVAREARQIYGIFLNKLW